MQLPAVIFYSLARVLIYALLLTPVKQGQKAKDACPEFYLSYAGRGTLQTTQNR